MPTTPKALALVITSGAGTWQFDIEGEWLPRRDGVFKEAANPPQLIEFRDVWEFQKCRLVSSDGTTATLWASWQSFRNFLETRTNFPTKVQVVRDPSGANAVVWTLGPGGPNGAPSGAVYEQFKIAAFDMKPDDLAPAATYRTVKPITISFSATLRFAEAVTGIVGWTQSVGVSYPDGLRILEWRTRLTTLEGTSSIPKAQTYAAINIAPFADHTYDTNGPNGIDYTTLDNDEQNTRPPTVIEVVSRIRQWGITIGVTAGGLSPSAIDYTVTTETTPLEIITTTQASARGPGALAWVLGKKPGGSLTRNVVIDQKGALAAAGIWESRVFRTGLPGSVSDGSDRSWTIKAKISGGAQDIDFEGCPNGFAPILFVGCFAAWKATVDVTVKKTGANLTDADMPFPMPLGDPWIFDQNASDEGEPEALVRGNDPSQDQYQREGRFIFWSATAPSSTLLAQLLAGSTSSSYFGIVPTAQQPKNADVIVGA